MKLIPHADVPRNGVEHSFGHRSFGAFMMLAIVLGLPLLPMAFGLVVGDLFGMPWWLWIVVGPILLAVVLVWLLVLVAMWRSVTACFRSTNWVMKLTFEGVYLQFRSYLNHHFSQEDPTVVFVKWNEIAAAQKSVHTTTEIDSDGDPRFNTTRYLDLHLKDEDTEKLRQAIAEETARGPQGKNRSKMRFHHAPVQTPEPGVIRVEWRGGKMLKALKSHVTIRPPRKTGKTEDTADAGEQIIALIEEGRHIAAVRTARHHYGMSLKEARDFVDDLAQPPKQEQPKEKAVHAIVGAIESHSQARDANEVEVS